ncbi:L,D-transpeptidase catalytic domain [Candidatus Anstonella stagnisolia]|nr:L,D-transpeptidase catalytic domain [Candidatus Anstonella stagnisolia]
MQDSLMQMQKQPADSTQKQQADSTRMQGGIAVEDFVRARLDAAYTKLVAHRDYQGRKSGMKEGVPALVLLGDLQKLYLVRRRNNDLEVIKQYPVSTGIDGFGNKYDEQRTPTGTLMIVGKRGEGEPIGTAFVGDEPIRIAKPHEAGKALMTSRMLVLSGSDYANRNIYNRVIRIHGTNKEKFIGKPASDGCIRMKNKDVVELFKFVQWGTLLYVEPKPDSSALKDMLPVKM